MPKRKNIAEVWPASAKRPRAQRTTVRLLASGRDNQGASADLEILNISTTGMLFRHSASNDLGASVGVLLPNGKTIGGQISWTDQDLVGFKFDVPISAADIAAVALKSEPWGTPLAKPREAAKEGVLRNLSKLRTDAGVTMEELADQIGVSRQAVWYWEQGRSKPRPAAMNALLDFLENAGQRSADPPRRSPSGFSAYLDRTKVELADYLGIKKDAIRIIVEK